MARSNKSYSASNVSRGSTRATRDIEFQSFMLRDEAEYKLWWTHQHMWTFLRELPDDFLWNCLVCILALAAIVCVVIEQSDPYTNFLDVVYNTVYAIHVLGIAYNSMATIRDMTFCDKACFVLDLASYLHYVLKKPSNEQTIKLICYYLRLHRPFRFIWSLHGYYLRGDVLVVALKYCYIFMVLRVTCAIDLLYTEEYEQEYIASEHPRTLIKIQYNGFQDEGLNDTVSLFVIALYIVNKMFIPIGLSVAPINDTERIACLLAMLTGCLVVSGAAVASLSLVISIHMKPEETFRSRYRLIMKEMKESNVPPNLREQVHTFYRMYWHKQRAVSTSQLLPTYPHTLPATVYIDIYFEAMQKSLVLCDLSYQFLSEVAKKMITTQYIPGDAIIKRNTRKSSIIFITYGDIEMLTAEDDSTAILRMTRGTILTPCGACVSTGCGRAHVEIRAATYCIAHVLQASDLWRVALKYDRDNEETDTILRECNEHLDKVKRNYYMRYPDQVQYKSSNMQFKKNLMNLKQAKDEHGNLLLERTDMFLEIAGCYVMRNRPDATLTDEADAICLRSTFPCILQPVSSLQVAWHSFVACIIVAVCFAHPYFLVFKKKVPIQFRFFDYVVTVIYVFDLIVHLSTGANVEEGVPITFDQTSSQQMRSHWFVLDVVGTLPIFEFIADGHFAGINKLLRLPKVFRVLKSLEDTCMYHRNPIRFMSFTFLLLIACYFIAALQQGFMCFQFEYCQVTNFTHAPFWERKPLDETTVENKLAFSLYWAISMITFTSHLEAFGKHNWHNVLYTMIVLEVCIVLHIFIEAVYSATIMVTTAMREEYDACIASVQEFLVRTNVDPWLRDRFITYLQLCWYTDKAYEMTNKKSSIFYDLPPHAYQNIVNRQRSKYIISIPFMKLLYKEDLKNVSTNAKLFYTSPNEILVNTGDIINEMYVIKQGICQILSPSTRGVVSTISVKGHFGVIECLLRLPAYYTVRAVTHVQVFSISRKHLLQAVEIPQIKDAIEFAKEQPEYARLLVSHEPFVSYTPPAPPPNTERFRLPRKYEQDYDFLYPFKRLGFLAVLRYIFPRFTIRPDGMYLTRYEWFRAFCALASAMIYPGYPYMVLQWPCLDFITLMLDFSAYFDVCQRMLVGYFNNHGILIYHPASTAAHYLKGAFLVDLFGCLPLERLESPRKEPYGDSFRVTVVTQVLMLNRLLQLYRFPSALEVLTGYMNIRRDIVLVIKAVPLFTVLANILTCLMVFASVSIYDNGSGWTIIPHDDKGGSWVNLFSKTFRFNITECPWNLHLASYFWVVYETTTTGYNCINPTNINLMQILFVGMLMGAMITTFFSVRIISIRANVNTVLAMYQAHMRDLQDFMKKERIHYDLQREMLEYYEFNWDKMGGIDCTNILKLCDQITLRTDTILHIYGTTFAKCPILSQCEVSVLRLIGRAVRSVYFLQKTNIIELNDVITQIYFVDYGIVSVRTVHNDLCSYVKLSTGSVFGNLQGAQSVRCPMSMTASTNVHLLSMSADTFYGIIGDFPSVLELLNEYRKNNEYYIIGDAGDSQLKPWKEPRFSLPIMIRASEGIMKYLNFRNCFLQTYLILVSLLCVYCDVYNAGFQDNRPGLIITLYVLDMGFYMKILLHYVSPHTVHKDDLKYMLLLRRKRYFKEEFKYDIISCLPIELLSFVDNKNRWIIFSCLRLNRMFRVVTVHKCLKLYQRSLTINMFLVTVFSVLIWFSLFIHTTASIWYFIGTSEEAVSPKSSWLYNDVGKSLCFKQYVCSLYFVLTTFTQNGVGDIMPKKQSEVVFVIILQIISRMIFMIYVGELSNLIQYKSFRAFRFYCKYLELQVFLKNNRVSKNLVEIVNKYSMHLWRESRGEQVPHFLKTAPQCLKLKLMSAAYMTHLTSNPIFQNCEPAFLRQLVGHLRLFTYNEKMYVVKENEITDSMYLIHKGKVEEISEMQPIQHSCYGTGQYFGALQGLLHNTPYDKTYRTLSKSQILSLRLSDWEYLLDHFQKSKAIIYGFIEPDDDGTDKSSSYPKDDNDFFTGLPIIRSGGPEEQGPPPGPQIAVDRRESPLELGGSLSGSSTTFKTAESFDPKRRVNTSITSDNQQSRLSLAQKSSKQIKKTQKTSSSALNLSTSYLGKIRQKNAGETTIHNAEHVPDSNNIPPIAEDKMEHSSKPEDTQTILETDAKESVLSENENDVVKLTEDIVGSNARVDVMSVEDYIDEQYGERKSLALVPYIAKVAEKQAKRFVRLQYKEDQEPTTSRVLKQQESEHSKEISEEENVFPNLTAEDSNHKTLGSDFEMKDMSIKDTSHDTLAHETSLTDADKINKNDVDQK